MSLFNFLMANRTKDELAKELAAAAKDNARLRDELHAARTELFWMKADERATLEQAAEVCDGLATLFPETNVGFDVGYTMAARRAAEDIRNLQEQP